MTSSSFAPKPLQVAAAVIGNALEWYDFIVFGFFAVIIARLFFPSESQYASLLLDHRYLRRRLFHATGRGFVPSVGRSLYGKIVEQLQLAGQPVPRDADQANAEQPAPGLPTTWDDIAVGHLVIAHEDAINGWWEAIVLARDGDMLTLKWRDYQQPHVVRHVGAVALLKPSPVSST